MDMVYLHLVAMQMLVDFLDNMHLSVLIHIVHLLMFVEILFTVAWNIVGDSMTLASFNGSQYVRLLQKNRY